MVIRDMMDGHRPAVWLSDRYCAQQGHADAQQTCLAHLARDVAYADEAGEDVLSRCGSGFGSKAPSPWRPASKPSPRRRSPPDDALWSVVSARSSRPRHPAIWREISRNRFRRARDQLLTFAKWPGLVDASNNGCERALRPSVIQRKVTNGYRAMWAAAGEADIRTVVDTARLRPGTNAFEIILQTVSA